MVIVKANFLTSKIIYTIVVKLGNVFKNFQYVSGSIKNSLKLLKYITELITNQFFLLQLNKKTKTIRLPETILQYLVRMFTTETVFGIFFTGIKYLQITLIQLKA